MHLLVLGLLALTAIRAATGSGGHHPAATIALCLVVAAVYVLGAFTLHDRGSAGRRTWWLAALSLSWLALLVLTPDAVWLAFPLYFLQLHLLSRRWGLAAVAATTLAAIGGYAGHRQALDVGAVIGPLVGAAVAVATVLGYQALYRESERRRDLIEQLTAARAELTAADRHAGVLAERERLAREIHDTLAQGLSSIQLLLRGAQRSTSPDQAAELVEQARRTAQDNLAEARRFVAALAPPDLEGSSLPTALERLCATTTQRSGLGANFRLDGIPTSLPTSYEVALLRVAQSAVANAVQHAEATHIEVTLSYMDRDVALDVVDDGVGFIPMDVADQPGTGGGFGLPMMRARVQALGGTLAVESAPGSGTAVAVFLRRPGQDGGDTP
jgi:signal transduction histidine kinase